MTPTKCYFRPFRGRTARRKGCAERLKIILTVVFFVIFVLLYMVFHSVAESAVLIFPTLYALTGGLILQNLLGSNFSVAVWVGYIALFGIAVDTGVVMVVYLREAPNRRLSDRPTVPKTVSTSGNVRMMRSCS